MAKIALVVFSLSVLVYLVLCQDPQPDQPGTQPAAQPQPSQLAAKANPLQATNANQVTIVNEENEVSPEGKFHWLYELSDGTKVEQNGEPKQGENGTVVAVSGSVNWVDPEGKTHTLTYVADENGYQPQGEDVPAIPDAIAKSISSAPAAPQE